MEAPCPGVRGVGPMGRGTCEEVPIMSRASSSRRRPSVHITLDRASRFHHLVRLLAETPRSRPDLLTELGIGLRTFYRELEFLRRCGVKVRHEQKLYHLVATAEQAEGRLPFPDPQLSFAEMAELAQCECGAGRRMAELLASVVRPAGTSRKTGKSGARPRSRKAARGPSGEGTSVH